jgi:biopolymer transport protein ExbB
MMTQPFQHPRRMLILCSLSLAFTGTARAAAPAAWGGELWNKTGVPLSQVMEAGGSLMYVLLGLSMLTVAMIVYLFSILRRDQIAPRKLQRTLAEMIRANDLAAAKSTCEENACPLAAVTLAALEYIAEAPNADAAGIKEIMVDEGSRQADDLQGQTQYLLDMAVVAPMVGLLGTVFGMLHAFGAVVHDIASAKPVVLAGGVSEALLTTAGGLIIGIPAMMFYAYFRRRAGQQIALLESSTMPVLAALQSRRT